MLISAITVICLTLIACSAIAAYLRGNVYRAAGTAIALTFLLPTWVRVDFFKIDCDLRVLTALAVAVVAAVSRPGWLFDRLLLSDVLVTVLVIWQTFSEWYATGRAVIPFVESYGAWALPYVVGRFTARSRSDLVVAGRVLMLIGIAWGVAVATEFTLGADVYQSLFGDKPGMKFHPPRKAVRWGLNRMEGPFRHPIFWGTVCMLLTGWFLQGVGRERGWWRLFAVAGFLGGLTALASTLSRGPILALPLAILNAVLIGYQKAVIGAVVVVIAAGVLFVSKPQLAEDMAMRLGDISEEREKTVVVDGQEQTMSSSMSRLLLLKNYWKAVKHAGFIGYGMTATDTMPPNVPHVPFDEVTRKPLPIIDNSYVMLALRGGWVQSIAFLLLHFSAMWQALRIRDPDNQLIVFKRMLAGCIGAHAFIVFTVYPDFDFMFVFLWTVGVTSVNLTLSDSDGGRVSEAAGVAGRGLSRK
ncbi:MAG: O-antigen ligase family protein [Planctomycetaceae bacterium]|nr:O-antigen ligase family protein [Planctomycetaceae bacterium]